MGSDLPKVTRGPGAGVPRRTVRFSTVSRKGAESATSSAESAPQRQSSKWPQTTLTLLKLKKVAAVAAFSTPEENGPPRAHKRKIGSRSQPGKGSPHQVGKDRYFLMSTRYNNGSHYRSEEHTSELQSPC